MLEDVLVSLMLLAVGAAGSVYLYWSASEKLRVWLSCLAWRRVEGVVLSSGLKESRTTHWVSPDDPMARSGPDRRVVHDPGWFLGWGAGPSKVTTTTVMPEFKLRYRVGEREWHTSNLDRAWNHSLAYARGDAEDWVRHFAPGTAHPLRVNPRAPREVFLGWRHFPYVWAPLQWVLGFFLGPTALAAAARPALEWLTGDGHAASQVMMVVLGSLSPVWILGRVALDVARGDPGPAAP